MNAWSLPNHDVFKSLAGQVHVWRLLISESGLAQGNLEPLLNAEEQKRAQRYYFKKDRERFIATRGFLRTLLGKYLDRDPKGLALSSGAQGKPLLEESAGLHFNVSHSERVAVLAFSGEFELGVDVEKADPAREYLKIADHNFAPAENKILRECAESEKIKVFYHFWTLKEALLKAWGEGLSIPLQAVEITGTSLSPEFLLHSPGLPAAVQAATLCRLSDPAESFSAAIAVLGKKFSLRCYEGSGLIQPASS